MKKSILFVIFLIFMNPLFAQEGKKDTKVEKEIQSKEKSLSEMSFLADQVNNNANCLIHYHNERKTAFYLGLSSSALFGLSISLNDKQNGQYITTTNPTTHIKTTVPQYPDFFKSPAGNWAIFGGVTGLISLILYIDAEKWIGSKKIMVTKDGLAYRF